MEKLHVVSFDIPYPANYGGVIVVYNQLLAWKEVGVKVILHAYQYGDRQQQSHLESVCEEVHYYTRNTGWKASLSPIPYIVNSRKSEDLFERLLKDDCPIFFEGIHTTAWLDHPKLKHRKKALRMHNVEWKYYQSLMNLGGHLGKRMYYKEEARRLKKYDADILGKVDLLFTISVKDQEYYAEQASNSFHLPAAHGEKVDIKAGRGDYFLFHGKLSVEDNKRAAILLMKEVFANVEHRFVIAGLNPDKALISEVAKYENVDLYANLSHEELKALMQDAQANILYTYQDNGIKLKLLHALHVGRHCIVNQKMVSNAPHLENLCRIGRNMEELKALVEVIKNEEFTDSDIAARETILDKHYDNSENTRKAVKIMKEFGFN